MSYGHTPLLFLDPVVAQRYLDACRDDGNRTSENYQDRVRAERCVMLSRGKMELAGEREGVDR